MSYVVISAHQTEVYCKFCMGFYNFYKREENKPSDMSLNGSTGSLLIRSCQDSNKKRGLPVIASSKGSAVKWTVAKNNGMF